VAQSRKVTLSDVAGRAGVSATTASYILNGRSAEMRISAGAQVRVREAAAELAYRPNRSARALRTATTKTFGLLSDFVASGQFASRMLTGASAAARAADHLLVMAESEGDAGLEGQIIEEMLDRQVDGIIYATVAARRATVPAPLHAENVVLLNCFDPASSLPTVLPDEFEGGRTAARTLIEAGTAERVFIVGHDEDARAIAGPLRVEGLTSGLAEAGKAVAGVVECAWRVPAAYGAVAAWLEHSPRPTALVCLNDRVAVGAYQALAEFGLRIPDDVAVVSFDGSDLAAWQRPPVTSIALPFEALGAAAVRVLMRDKSEPAASVRLPMSLVSGGSVPTPRPADRRSARA
jgi:LacI family transcriptional regulator, galactose operon repressor